MSTSDPDIFAGLTFAEDFAAEAVALPRPADRVPPQPDRDGEKWRGEDPRLPERLSERLRKHLSGARVQGRAAARRGDAAATARAQRRIDLAQQGLGAAGGSWWSRTPAEASARAEAALTELDREWGTR